jgi:hypothetical protein
MSSSNRRTAATVYTNSLPAAPSKVAEQKELHGKPSSTRKSRTSNKHTKTQKKKKKKLGEKQKQNSTLETHRKEGQTSSRKTKFRPPKTSTQEKKQTNKACNDKKKYKKTLSYILTLKEGRCDCKQEKARDARFHS